MADGLLTSILGAIDRQKQATKAGLGLLVNDPMEFARNATARYFPTPEEVAQQRALEQSGGIAMNTPYMDKMFNLAQFQGSIKPTGLLNNNQVVYHGSTKAISELNPKKSFGDLNVSWVSPSPEFASKYATREGGNVMPLLANEGKVFDFADQKSLDKLIKKASNVEIYDPVRGSITLDRLVPMAGDSYKTAENPQLFNLIKKMGYDSVAVYEDGVRNLGIFNPKKNIKSKFE